MLQLVVPDVSLREAWLDAHAEWGHGVHQDGAGLHDDDDVDSAAGFADWVARLHRQSDTSIPPDPGRVHCSYWWIVDGDDVLGAVALRHELNDYLLNVGGHIGYGVRPSARRRGIATWALGQALDAARDLGLHRVLVTCADDNVASARVIEKRGGVLENVRDDPEFGLVRRYWISLENDSRLQPTAGRLQS